jgi:GH24 family phage-related lysozyme (muramidase)
VKISNAGIKLIREFEGCRLTSYVCPTGILTIGIGHTGPDVYSGQKITDAEANALLQKDLVRFEKAVSQLITVPLTQAQFDALVSFTFNSGAGALEKSTLRKRLNNKENPNKVVKEELIKWVKGSNGPLPGLIQRRNAEIKLFCSVSSATLSQKTPVMKTIDIRSSQQTWFKKEPVENTQLSIDKLAKVVQGRDYRGCKILAQKDGYTQLELPGGMGIWWVYDKHWEGLQGRVVPRRNVDVNTDTVSRKLLAVPYQSQRDNYRDADRTCFSSSCAMAAMYLKPGSVKNDNEYIKKVFAIGDSTSSAVQVKVLQSLGLKAVFKQSGRLLDLVRNLKNNVPIPIGILHHGPLNAPSGGGHWILITGYDDSTQKFTVNDPWGEIDKKNGTYISTDGYAKQYSYGLIRSRWLIEGDGSGWYIDLA